MEKCICVCIQNIYIKHFYTYIYIYIITKKYVLKCWYKLSLRYGVTLIFFIISLQVSVFFGFSIMSISYFYIMEKH